MNQLEEKYISNCLSADELKQLRQTMGEHTDEQLAAALEARWEKDEVDTSTVEDDRLAVIRSRVDRRTGLNRRNSLWRKVWTWGQRAAVVMLPLLLAAALYLYRENATLQTDAIVVATAGGERATVTLPDGTRVMLNEQSRLSYDARSFNKSVRQLQFDGEGWFEVAKDADHPFSVGADGLAVQVLGTKFNLLARSSMPQAELSLEEGRVAFSAVASGERVVMQPNQHAVLDKQSGRIVVETLGDGMQDLKAWQRKEFVFRNVPLSTVIATLEKAYGVKFQVSSPSLLNDHFTGTMSSANINEDLEILERSYHMTATLSEGNVRLEK